MNHPKPVSAARSGIGRARFVLLSLGWWVGAVVIASAGGQEPPPANTDPAPPTAAAQPPQVERAWEYQPYQIKVWICTDGSADLVASYDRLVDGILTRMELIDGACLRFDVEPPSSTWRYALLEHLDHPEQFEDLVNVESLEGWDKLMVVCLENVQGQVRSRVREFDMTTQQWGPLGIETVEHLGGLIPAVSQAMAQAFMPIARVERITDKDEVFTRARAVKSCIVARRDETGAWYAEDNTASPVWIQPTDRFLPVIRRTDRSGNLIRLEPVDFTFLTIDQQDESESQCSIQSYHRAPLAGRESKRAQKLALVVRPPSQSTTLRLFARDRGRTPMEGVEIWSGHPGAEKGEFEMLGKSDWKGEFDVPPSDRGMRIIYLKRGNRALMKLPMIPGFHPVLEAEVPNDETRLFAEGVITGLNNEILNLVAQRALFESEIQAAIDAKDGSLAREVLLKYQDLPSTQELKNRLGNEETQLKSQTSSRRELDYIASMFSTLSDILNSEAAKSRESELREQIQNLPLGSETSTN